MTEFSQFVRRLVLLGLIGMAASGCGDRDPSRGKPLPVKIDRYREVEDFTFTNQKAEPFQRGQLTGKVWVANFVFTSCGAECLILSQKMAALQNRFADRDDVAFASFSVDPQTDHPERLQSYAKRWGANDERWQFLTGDPARLDAIIKQSFLLPVALTPMDKADLMTAGFVHSNKFAIVDRRGVVRAYVEGLESNAIDEAARVIGMLLAEPEPPNP